MISIESDEKPVKQKKSFPKFKIGTKIFKLLTLLVVIIIVCYLGFYLYESTQAKPVEKFKNLENIGYTEEIFTKDDKDSMIKRVSLIYDIPSSKNIQVLDVKDAKALRDTNPFFSKVTEGDKILLDSDTKVAVVYRPSRHQVITVGQIDSSTQESKASESNKSAEADNSKPAVEAEKVSELKVTVLNGTTTAGLAGKVSTLVTGVDKSITVVGTGNSGNSGKYPKSVLVNASGSTNPLIKKLIDTLKLELVSKLPEKEVAPTDGSLLVIVGEDRAKTP